MSDVNLFQAPDGGEIEVINGQITMIDGLAVSIYLSLFGGNEDDGAIQATDSIQWWGNHGENPDSKYRSRTQWLLRSIPAIPANMLRIEAAVLEDLAWVKSRLQAELSCEVYIPQVNRVTIEVSITIDGNKTDFRFGQDWRLL